MTLKQKKLRENIPLMLIIINLQVIFLKELVNKSDISYLRKNSLLNTKLTTFAAKAEQEAKQDKIVKLQTHDNFFLGKNCFSDDDFQNMFISKT